MAQESESSSGPLRTRVSLGPQIYPASPGADEMRIGAYVDVDRARGDEPFAFAAADDSFDVTLARAGGFSVGPVANWLWARKSEDVGGALPKVGFSFEAGGFAEYELGDNFRLRGELRKGLSGHDGLTGVIGADAILRDRDQWLFSIGPRVTWSNDTYHDAYFSVTPADAEASDLPAYDAGAGIQAVGVIAGFLTQLTPRWGLVTYAKYDRLVGDAADSPVVRTYGSRDQLSGGLALTYTFGSAVD